MKLNTLLLTSSTIKVATLIRQKATESTNIRRTLITDFIRNRKAVPSICGNDLRILESIEYCYKIRKASVL